MITVALSLAVTPIDSGFRLADKQCELLPAANMVLKSLLNGRHIVACAVMLVLAAFSIKSRPLLKAAPLVLILSGMIELQQFYFASGHCRLRDLLPDAMGIAVGIGVYLGIIALLNARSNRAGRREACVPVDQR